MTTISSHVLDTALGRPASGMAVDLDLLDGARTHPVGTSVTDADGRVGDLSRAPLHEGVYRLTFDTAGYFAATGQRGLFPVVTVTFTVADPGGHYHVPLLLSPFAYSVYRGS
ncbi:hydroxyisourate hydrolase [Mycobacterium koreense]|uniref:5-hydroxyisourate hydrolase n=1 Tax=Mycolicibacillus koreensis TaxID=1069220 RepID=A0A7I7SAK0_9MYCO|nr:hydroxyisourate hydrolase [Mycolicibacillus koreensis]MCV7247034.1 hydroxyisourate hydrolase [Mycolicibacillus koreensis]ODR11419.1 hydroxyisourate hydrolase [Mycolicibacillus koreensis]OSC35060.1 hydroxyisourate hydrolase [Mycolicibacillus koreensis]BBY53490.1 5-hydroxyisourate hydrolase [Mycolicibacillus koreensis]